MFRDELLALRDVSSRSAPAGTAVRRLHALERRHERVARQLRHERGTVALGCTTRRQRNLNPLQQIPENNETLTGLEFKRFRYVTTNYST